MGTRAGVTDPARGVDVETLEIVMDTIDEFIVLFRRDDGEELRVAFANKAFLRSCASRPDVIGRTPDAAMVPRLSANLVEGLAALAADGTSRYHDRIDAPTGPIDLAVTLSEPGGAPGPILWVGHDVTERRRQERALARVREELERSNADLASFAAIASHDLQEPLRMVASYVELLSRRYSEQLDERAQTYIGFALEGAQRMRALIDALLDYARLRTAPRLVEEVSLDGLVAQVLHDVGSRVRETSAEVTVDPLPTVQGDAGELSRLFQNLIANALKFHRDEAPKVRVAVTSGPTEWCFTIDDNGIGVPEPQREPMFEMFGRGQPRGEFPGHGVGLAVCRSIVGRHGGRIRLEESPTAGVRVAFTLPTTPPKDLL